MAPDNENVGGGGLQRWFQSGGKLIGSSAVEADKAILSIDSGIKDFYNGTQDPTTLDEARDALLKSAVEGGKDAIIKVDDETYDFLQGVLHPQTSAEILKNGLSLITDQFESRKEDATGKPLSHRRMYLPGDDWGPFKIGPATFSIPPISVKVSEINSSSASAFVARSRTSSKINPGNKMNRVEMTFIFNTYDDIVGTSEQVQTMAGDGSWKPSEDIWGQINSLRGLIALFRGAPFLPVRHRYLNEVWNIDMLAMEGLQISTVPGVPYAITATLSAYQFNWRALVPIEGDAWDILNEDRFLFHYSALRKQLDDYVGVPFTPDRIWGGSKAGSLDAIIGAPDAANPDLNYEDSQRGNEYDLTSKQWATDEQQLLYLFGPPNNNHYGAGQLELYYSDRDMATEMWLSNMKQNKIIDPSKMDGGIGKAIGDAIGIAGLGALVKAGAGGSVNASDLALDVQTQLGKTLSENDQQQKVFLAYQFLFSVSKFAYADEESDKKRMQELRKQILEKNQGINPSRAEQLAYVTMTLLNIEAITKNKKVLAALKDPSVGWIHEWEIPMRRLGLMNEDLAKTVIIESISVSTQNALTALPIAGKVSGVHQHMGNLGTNTVLSLKVIGERSLKYLKNRLDRVSYAAMRNKENGVSGFLGVENHLMNLMGVKYAMLDSMDVSTIEGQPHSYHVTIQMSDFDVLQQKREMPTAIERLGMAERMSKGHPVMRARQELGRMSAYPDMPLPRRKVNRTAIVPSQTLDTNAMNYEVKQVTDWGPYYDPDYYFNSAYFRYENGDGAEVSYDKDKKGRPAKMPDFTPSMKLFVPDFQKWIKVFVNSEGDMGMKAKVPKVDSQGQPTNNPTSPQDEFDEITVARTYIPGQNENTTTSWLNKAMAGTAKMPHGADVQDNDVLAALSRVMVYGNDERNNMKQMLREHSYQNVEGRMIQAFPTCVVYIIDEGGFFLTYKLYDTFYGIQALISADVSSSKDAVSDTAVLQFSNLYGKLSTEAWWQDYSLPRFITEMVSTAKNIRQRAMGYVDSVENMKLEPGMRVQVRAGYSADPTKLPVIFNGSIAEVSDGTTLTVIASGDGAELNKIMEKNFSGNMVEGGLKWQYLWLNSPFVEPQQVLVKMLAGEGKAWSEAMKRAEAGIAQGGAASAAPHFGAVIWDTTAMGGDKAFRANIRKTITNITTETKAHGKAVEAGASSGKPSGNPAQGTAGLTRTAWNVLGVGFSMADDVAGQYWTNTYNLLQDFEIYKRNIYPGNGTGMRGWDTDPQPNTHPFGWMSYVVQATDADYAFSKEDTDKGALDERKFELNTGGKTNWQIMQMCEAVMPNYILAVRPFEHRSTLFYGKQAWLYTSGVIPFFDGDTVDSDMQVGDWRKQALALNDVYQAANSGVAEGKKLTALDWNPIHNLWKPGFIPITTHDTETKTDGAISIRAGANAWGWAWLKDVKTIKWAKLKLLKVLMSNDEFCQKWASYMQWVTSDSLKSDILLARICADALYSCHDNILPGWSTLHGGKGFDGPRKEDSWINGSDGMWKAVLNLYKDWERLGEGLKDPDDQLKSTLRGIYVETIAQALVTSTSTSDPGKVNKLIDEVGKAPAKEAPKTTPAKDADVTDAMDQVRQTVAMMIMEKAGGIQSMMEMSAQNDMIGQLEWRCLEDNSYYGVLAGTLYDPYAGAEYYTDTNAILKNFGNKMQGNMQQNDWVHNLLTNLPFIGPSIDAIMLAWSTNGTLHEMFSFFNRPGPGGLLSSLGVFKQEPPEDIKRLRAAQILVDNPFTKEFGEPVVEIREPFSRFHSITSETNLVANTLTLDESQVFNQIVAIAHASGKNDGKKKLTVKADMSIPAHLIRETVVDTGLNYSVLNVFDKVNHRNMALYQLKRSLQKMYGGELVVLGNPNYRSYDFLWMWDSVQRMNGMCEIEGVTHHYGADVGFVTSVRVAPIVMVEDAYLFHILNMFGMNKQEEHSLKFTAQNIAAGAVDQYQADSEAQRLSMEDVYVGSMSVLDGNPASGVNYGMASVMSPFMKSDKAGDITKAPTYRETDNKIADMINNPDSSKTAGKSDMPWSLGASVTMAGASTYAPSLALGALFVGGMKQAIGAYFEEPIQVITLSKDGRPFQAGLRGSRGVIIGQPGSVPLLSDWFGYETLPADPSTVFSKFGYKLDTGIKIRNAVSESELMSVEELERLSGRAEADVNDELSGEAGLFVTHVVDFVDADTFYFPMADLPAEVKSKVKASAEKPDCWTCRMRYYDAPEVKHPGGVYQQYSSDVPNYGGEEITEWMRMRIPVGTELKIRYNKASPCDAYNRLLTVVVDPKSCPENYSNDTYLSGSSFSWMKDSLNGEVLTSNAEIKIWSNDSHTTYQTRALRELVQPLFTIPDEDSMFIRR
jgi:hypothetical protein